MLTKGRGRAPTSILKPLRPVPQAFTTEHDHGACSKHERRQAEVKVIDPVIRGTRAMLTPW